MLYTDYTEHTESHGFFFIKFSVQIRGIREIRVQKGLTSLNPQRAQI